MNSSENVNSSADPRISTVDANGIPYSERLKRAREAIGRSPQDVARLVGVSEETYRDWEWGEGDISNSASLAELAKLASTLGIRTLELFQDAAASDRQVSPVELAEKIRAHLSATGLRLDELEDRIGFELKPALESSSEILNWNLDYLRFVCYEIGADWRLALA